MSEGPAIEWSLYHQLLLQFHEGQRASVAPDLSIAKVNANSYEELHRSFIKNYVQTSQWVIITDFNNIQQLREEHIQDLFAREGDISYNYNLKKTNDETMGHMADIPEDNVEANHGWLLLPLEQCRGSSLQIVSAIWGQPHLLSKPAILHC